MIEIGTVLGAYTLARTVAELTGLIESIGVKIDRLSRSDLQAALRALDQAQRATTESESLLRDARSRLNKALSLEKEERLAAAYLALAATHHQLGDAENTKQILREFLETTFSPPIVDLAFVLARQTANATDLQLTAGAALVAALFPIAPFMLIGGADWMLKQLQRKAQIEGIKDSVRAYLNLHTDAPDDVTHDSSPPPRPC